MDTAEYKDLFVSESQEHLQALNEAILDLQREPNSVEPLERIFRSAHTLKGMAATMGYEGMSQLAHDVEDLLYKARKGILDVAPMLIALLFECVDILNTMLEDIVAEKESQVDLTAILHKLGQYQSIDHQPPHTSTGAG